MNAMDFVKENVVFYLVNAENNKEMLSNIPHRHFFDLSIVYRVVIDVDTDGMRSFIVDNNTMTMIGITEGELFSLSKKNTRRLLPSTTINMNDMLKIENSDNEIPMIVISNSFSLYGAATILYEDVLYNIAEGMGEDLYLLPSSIHEFIVVPSTIGDKDSLMYIIKMVNNEVVKENERLSDNVYYYDMETKMITQL